MENINNVTDLSNPFKLVNTKEVNNDNFPSVVNGQPINGQSVNQLINKEVNGEVNKKPQLQEISKQQVTEQPIAQEKLEDVVSELNQMMSSVQRDLSFSIDENSGREVISIYEKGTDILIRQLPSEEALKILENLTQLKGLLLEVDV
jgi:uncharacterized FlaG/YvyC family protein